MLSNEVAAIRLMNISDSAKNQVTCSGRQLLCLTAQIDEQWESPRTGRRDGGDYATASGSGVRPEVTFAASVNASENKASKLQAVARMMPRTRRRRAAIIARGRC